MPQHIAIRRAAPLTIGRGLLALAAFVSAGCATVRFDEARLNGRVAVWCRAEFRSGHPGAFAVGVTAANGGGRYVALDVDGSVTELGSFKRAADLSCYSPARAEELDAAIRQSETISGHITPRWKTTVVCGFIDANAAVCWQYAPAERKFIKVGEWVT